ncbi:MAG: VCBS repeat-containing protein, partial [Saprospiraceae bacterium]|nr:VCBS repeat-containing protein [Saprospiraceae bacterium]
MQKLIWVVMTVLVMLACGAPAPESDTLFTLMPSRTTGIDFRNDLMEDIYTVNNVLSFEYYYNGGGVAIGDINNDGLQDVFLTGNTADNQLYLNKGKMRFENITESSGILVPKAAFSTGVTMADVNGDGWLDIYVCQGGPDPDPAGRQNLLFINNQDNTFREAGAEYGLNDTNRSTQAAFFDADKDGDLDCFVMNYSKYFRVDLGLVFKDLENKQKLIEASSRYFRNDNGRYVDVTESAGMLKYGYGLGLVISDINDDGWLDIYQANDYSVPDFMYINQRDGTFRDEQNTRTKQISWFAMGADIADINNDGLKDIAVVDMAADDHVRGKTLMASMDPRLFWYAVKDLGYQYQYMFNSMLLNTGNGFSNVANLTGLAKTDWSWAALFADFDTDGYKDYFVSNGYRRYARDNDFRIALRKAREENGGNVPHALRQKYYEMMPQVPLANVIFRNTGDLHFDEVTEEWGMNQPTYSNGAAYADLDNDGDLDMVVNNIDDEAFVYRNNREAMPGHHYLRVALKSDRDVTGTTVEIWAGDSYQILEHSVARGFQAAVDPVLLFGLGEHTEVDRLFVRWPNGRGQELTGIPANQTITLDIAEGTGARQPKPPVDHLFTELSAEDAGGFLHVENDYDDFVDEILLPYQQSTLGPHLGRADVNGDGREDYFIGGASGQSGALMLQAADGTFRPAPSQPWSAHAAQEDLGSHFFDADGDGDLDLYIVSGGNEFITGHANLQDRLYFNDGRGQFAYRAAALPEMTTSGLRVASCDYDGDGDLDLFVGGRHKPQHYPDHHPSYLLQNNGGTFADVTDTEAPVLRNAGLVNDILWTDFDGDGREDLILAREWNSIGFYRNTASGFVDATDDSAMADYRGWWFRLAAVDVDNDGDQDLIAGNLGHNSKFHAELDHPFHIFASDFDQNGTWDLVLSKEYKGELVPVRGRECSSQQMPFILDKFPTYKDFATASLPDIYGSEELERSVHMDVTEFSSMVLINDGQGVYTPRPLPTVVQMAPIYGIGCEDLNGDGNVDLIVAGNLYTTEVETPRLDAGNGFVLKGDGTGGFTPVDNTGFYVPG